MTKAAANKTDQILSRNNGINTEAAAYEVDQILGLNYVRITISKSLNGVNGSVQLFNAEPQTVNKISHPDHLMMFDYLISNHDRHRRNYMVSKKYQIVAIDHRSAFLGLLHPKNFIQTAKLLFEKLDETKKYGKASIAYWSLDGETKLQATLTEAELRSIAKSIFTTMTVSRSVYQNLKQTTDRQWRLRLEGKLPRDQIDSLLVRRQEIIEAVERARRVFGDDILSDHPYSPILRRTIEAPERPKQ